MDKYRGLSSDEIEKVKKRDGVKAIIVSTPREVNNPWFKDFMTIDEASDIKEEVWESAFDNADIIKLEEVVEVTDRTHTYYKPNQAGRIILSNTKQIGTNQSVIDLPLPIVDTIAPIIEMFFEKNGKVWMINGPIKLSAYNADKDRWKSISALGGEKLTFQDVSLGSRDGLGINWIADDMSGISETLTINTVINKLGKHLCLPDGKKHMSERPNLMDELLHEVGTVDFPEFAVIAKKEAELVKKRKIEDEIKSKQEAYGAKFGAWA